jgi:hypothetical protein
MFPQLMLYAVTLLFFVTGSVAQSRAEWKDDARPTHSSLIAIAKWVSANADLPMMTNLPGVELVPLAELTRRREKGLASFYTGAAFVAAGYDDATRTIYLPENWSNKSPTDESVLVHEMVHHMQNEAGIKYACGDARAEPAYVAQDKWLRTHGLTLTQEFQVDMLALEAKATCM